MANQYATNTNIPQSGLGGSFYRDPQGKLWFQSASGGTPFLVADSNYATPAPTPSVTATTSSQIGGVDIPPATGFDPGATWQQYSTPPAPPQQPSATIMGGGPQTSYPGSNIPTNENVPPPSYYPPPTGINIPTNENVSAPFYYPPPGGINVPTNENMPPPFVAPPSTGINVPTNENISPSFYYPPNLGSNIPTNENVSAPFYYPPPEGINIPTNEDVSAPFVVPPAMNENPLSGTPPGGLTGTVPSDNPFANPAPFDITTGVQPTGMQFPGYNYSPGPDGSTYVYDSNWNYVQTLPGQQAPAAQPASEQSTPPPQPAQQDAAPASPYDVPSYTIGGGGVPGGMPAGTGGLNTIGSMFETGGTSGGSVFGASVAPEITNSPGAYTNPMGTIGLNVGGVSGGYNAGPGEVINRYSAILDAEYPDWYGQYQRPWLGYYQLNQPNQPVYYQPNQPGPIGSGSGGTVGTPPTI